MKNLSKDNFLKFINKNKILIIIFLVSFLFSIIVLFTGKNILHPKHRNGDDDYYYFLNALRVKENILKSPISFIFNLLTDSYTQEEYIKMGFIDNDIDSVFRAPFFIFFWAFILLIFGNSIYIIWIFNSLIFAFNSLLFYVISFKLYRNKLFSLIFTILFIIYPSFHLIKIGLNTEPFLNLILLLLIFYSIKAIDEKKSKYFFIVGSLLYLASLVKLSIQYLAFLFLIFAIFYFRKYIDNTKERKKLFISFLGGILLIMLPWKFLTYRATGEFSLTSVTIKSATEASAGRAAWQSSDPYCNGISPDGGRSASIFFRKAINKVKPSNYLWFYYSEICSQAVKNVLYAKPITFIKNSIKKSLILLISPPSANYSKYFNIKLLIDPLLGSFHFILHNFIIFFALLSIFFPYKNFSKKIILILILFYHLGVHGVSHIESRYLDTAMPTLFLLAIQPLIYFKNN